MAPERFGCLSVRLRVSLQRSFFSESPATFVTSKRSFASVVPHVVLVCPLWQECSWARVTVEQRPFPVREAMRVQCVFVCKCSATQFAPMPFLSRVRHHMLVEVPTHGECPATHGTLKWSLARVYPHVPHQISFERECPIAQVAVEWTLPSVNPHMRPDGPTLPECLATRGTFEGFLARMYAHVLIQAVLLEKYVATHSTFELTRRHRCFPVCSFQQTKRICRVSKTRPFCTKNVKINLHRIRLRCPLKMRYKRWLIDRKKYVTWRHVCAVMRCPFSTRTRLKPLPHTTQMCGLSPLCLLLWTSNRLILLKDLPQVSHWCIPTEPCSCVTSRPFKECLCFRELSCVVLNGTWEEKIAHALCTVSCHCEFSSVSSEILCDWMPDRTFHTWNCSRLCGCARGASERSPRPTWIHIRDTKTASRPNERREDGRQGHFSAGICARTRCSGAVCFRCACARGGSSSRSLWIFDHTCHTRMVSRQCGSSYDESDCVAVWSFCHRCCSWRFGRKVAFLHISKLEHQDQTPTTTTCQKFPRCKQLVQQILRCVWMSCRTQHTGSNSGLWSHEPSTVEPVWILCHTQRRRVASLRCVFCCEPQVDRGFWMIFYSGHTGTSVHVRFVQPMSLCVPVLGEVASIFASCLQNSNTFDTLSTEMAWLHCVSTRVSSRYCLMRMSDCTLHSDTTYPRESVCDSSKNPPTQFWNHTNGKPKVFHPCVFWHAAQDLLS